MKKIIITVVGKDTVGILAKTCTYLAKANINILDISQTVVSGYFNMMMIADGAKCRKPFEDRRPHNPRPDPLVQELTARSSSWR